MSSFGTEVIVVRFLPWEHRMVERIADSRGLTTSDFIRATLGLEPEEDARLADPAVEPSGRLA
jgi:hypothetical protein